MYFNNFWVLGGVFSYCGSSALKPILGFCKNLKSLLLRDQDLCFNFTPNLSFLEIELENIHLVEKFSDLIFKRFKMEMKLCQLIRNTPSVSVFYK